MKEIWIDNYSISETGPGYYLISMNGTPCVYSEQFIELSEDDMKRILLDYIQGSTEIKAGDKDD